MVRLVFGARKPVFFLAAALALGGGCLGRREGEDEIERTIRMREAAAGGLAPRGGLPRVRALYLALRVYEAEAKSARELGELFSAARLKPDEVTWAASGGENLSAAGFRLGLVEKADRLSTAERRVRDKIGHLALVPEKESSIILPPGGDGVLRLGATPYLPPFSYRGTPQGGESATSPFSPYWRVKVEWKDGAAELTLTPVFALSAAAGGDLVLEEASARVRVFLGGGCLLLLGADELSPADLGRAFFSAGTKAAPRRRLAALFLKPLE